MAAWSSANKYSLMGGIRAAAQLIAYELPLVLAAAAVAMQAGSADLAVIVERQGWWGYIVGPLVIGFFVYGTAALAELTRPPFDMPVADSELVFGHLTEYTGLRFAFFLLTEYAGIVSQSAIAATLFLGGWKGPFLDGPWWLAAKVLRCRSWSSGPAPPTRGCARTSCSRSPGCGWCRCRWPCSWWSASSRSTRWGSRCQRSRGSGSSRGSASPSRP
jgi:NADH:ubiquinone oxidoreductase subunit H